MISIILPSYPYIYVNWDLIGKVGQPLEARPT